MKQAKILQKNGYKLTQPRLDVLTVLKKNNEPLSAQDIHAYIPSSDLVSIYRSLKLFVQLGICYEEHLENNESTYALAEQHHHHIVCRVCQKKECIPCDHHVPTLKHFTHITHTLTLTGVCLHCNQ